MNSVRAIYAYYKTYGIKTVVMGASFRNTGEIEALAGCDRLTISPQLLEALSKEEGELPRQLDPEHPGLAPPRIAMDEKRFRWMLNEDQMATEKLSDGIRLFAHDLQYAEVDGAAPAGQGSVTGREAAAFAARAGRRSGRLCAAPAGRRKRHGRRPDRSPGTERGRPSGATFLLTKTEIRLLFILMYGICLALGSPAGAGEAVAV